MRDIQTLRQRITEADKHFRSAEEARHREGESLLQTWDELRRRFADQQQEIARYRARLETLVEANDELATMVDRLVATVEGSARRAQEEPVPRITALAQQLLGGEPTAEEMTTLKQALAEPETETAPGEASAAGEGGIRTLVERIESYVDRAAREAKTGAAPPAGQGDDDLAHELEEIEGLRSELTGLRDRIASDGRGR